MDDIKYRVHGVATVSRPRKVMYEGKEIAAQIEGVDVDLVPAEDMAHGTLTLSFVGAAAARARDEFKNGGIGTITWTPAKATEVLAVEGAKE